VPLVSAFASIITIVVACWTPPVDAPVIDPFRAPACERCPGNRGLEYETRTGQPVVAVASGEVTFSGTVAGTRYVVVRHADGRRATYGKLASSSLQLGDVVRAGARIGSTTRAFFFGLRDGERYVDPAPLLGRVVRPPRLVPTDGTAPPPAPAGRVVCAVPPARR
jgi:murein DD-endopeptidase MepM/ murein hydrolase activator NlpD